MEIEGCPGPQVLSAHPAVEKRSSLSLGSERGQRPGRPCHAGAQSAQPPSLPSQRVSARLGSPQPPHRTQAPRGAALEARGCCAENQALLQSNQLASGAFASVCWVLPDQAFS